MKISPLVSVIMPAYNAQKYVAEAIESILNQSFKDFEFIIIDDGSTDRSPEIIDRYAKKDKRIRIIRHENRGYALVLNEGLAFARGAFIARMDADDISRKDRFKKQITYLNEHPECVVLASTIQPIDEDGSPIDDWRADRLALTPEQIRSLIVKENCIAHPSIMARADIMRRFKYDVNQLPSEDYDLWLRLLSSKLQIHKLKDKMVFYRVHSASVSQTSIRQTSVQKKYLTVKTRFLTKQLMKLRFGRIEIKITYSLLGLVALISWSKAKGYINMLRAKKTSIVAKFRRNSKDKLSGQRILLVMPWMTAGGADKVFLDLATYLHNSGYQIFCMATVPSKNEWRKFFERVSSEVVIANEKAHAGRIPQFIVDYCTQNKIETVLTSNNAAGYLAAAGLRMSNPQIKIIDIIHGQGGKLEKGGWPFHSTPFDKYLNKRVVVTEYMKRCLIDKYKIPASKIKIIHNGIKVDNASPPEAAKEFKALDDKFIVLWSGRFSEEKHPELAIETARIVFRKNKNIHFVMAGDGEKKKEVLALINKYGIATGVTVTKRSYEDYRPYMVAPQLLFMTSEMEGLPMVILEAFSMGVPVIAPQVGGIPELIDNSKNGYLINFSDNFAERAAEKILYLSKHPGSAAGMGMNGREKVERSFSLDTMVKMYEKVIL